MALIASHKTTAFETLKFGSVLGFHIFVFRVLSSSEKKEKERDV